MLEFDLAFFALAIPAVMFAGVSKGGFGSGAAFVATPILALAVPPSMALGVMLPLLMLADVTTLRAFWRQWNWPCARRIIFGAVPGVVLAGIVYKAVDPNLFRLLIGVIALAFVGWQLSLKARLFRFRARPFSPSGGYVAGGVAGFTSFISHAGGPPVAVYLLAEGMRKTTYQATTVLCFWVINILKVVPYAFLGIFNRQTMVADLYLAPFIVIGALVGVKAHRMMPERLFFSITYFLLTLTGGKLIWDALT